MGEQKTTSKRRLQGGKSLLFFIQNEEKQRRETGVVLFFKGEQSTVELDVVAIAVCWCVEMCNSRPTRTSAKHTTDQYQRHSLRVVGTVVAGDTLVIHILFFLLLLLGAVSAVVGTVQTNQKRKMCSPSFAFKKIKNDKTIFSFSPKEKENVFEFNDDRSCNNNNKRKTQFPRRISIRFF